MTATMHPGPASDAPAPGGSAPAPRSPAVADELTGRSAAQRTALALLASAIGILPLKELFSDSGWLIDAWFSMVIAVGPALLIRLRRPPGALDIWPGIVLLVPWLTIRFVPDHAWGRFIPTGHTWHDVGRLMDQLHQTTQHEVAPIHTTVPVRLVVCALLGLLAALIDLIAVVGHRGALAGVPLLIVYTVSGAVPREPVSWYWFIAAAIAFLLLLAIDAGNDLRDWGRHVRTTGGNRSRVTLAVSVQRIGAAAVVAAVVLPLLVPGHPRNLIADAFHGGGGSGAGNGFGAGGGNGGGGSISPFVELKGQLDRPKPSNLMTVNVSKTTTAPYYLVTNILSKYNGDEWSVGDHGDTERIGDTNFNPAQPVDPALPTAIFTARINVSGLTGNAPVFRQPTSIDGLDDGTTYSAQDELLLGSDVHRGDDFTEQVAQPNPTLTELRAAGDASKQQMRPFLALPDNVPSYVRNLVTKLTKDDSSPYGKARAIMDYFTKPANGFTYSLKTKPGDSGSALVDFLKNKVGFCQQYAAAMGVMLRVAGVPARVALGYEHAPSDKQGNFTVTTQDAHAWVEVYFSGLGWIPFDPTPTDGLTGDASSDLVWAPHSYPSVGSNAPEPSNTATNRARPDLTSGAASTSAPATAAGSTSSGSISTSIWVLVGLLVVIVLALVPAAARATRRRRRYRAATRSGDADALWAELSDTAVDLGYVWSPARSPRQVATWLARDTVESSDALRALAGAVEHRRYSPDAGVTDGRRLAGELREVTGELRSRRSGRARLRAAFWPASLGWGRRSASRPRRAR